MASLPHFAARLSTDAFDRNTVDSLHLSALGAFCIVDAAGPFQGSDYLFARRVIEAGANYVDIADGRAFVLGFQSLDELARRHGVCAVSGASSTPGLSLAVLKHLTLGMDRVDTVETAILPGGNAVLGLSVVRAILSYAGKPISVRRFGTDTEMPGWGALRMQSIPVLGKRLLSLVETPDLDLVPKHYPTVRSAAFLASVEQYFMHMGLWVLSLPVRARWVTSLLPLAEPLHVLSGLFRPFGGDVGGMWVEATGLTSEGTRLRRRWTLIARQGDGPNIPALPALCVLQAMLSGQSPKSGVHEPANEISLSQLENSFKRFAISTQIEESTLPIEPLFARVAGDFQLMPIAVQVAHSPAPSVLLSGEARVQAGSNIFARVVARLAGFPVRSSVGPAQVRIEQDGDGEVWFRDFGSSAFSSRLTPSDQAGRINEQFGPVSVEMSLSMNSAGFRLEISGWALFGFRLPSWLAPDTVAGASSDSDGRYRFDVSISWFPAGRLVHYSGWLAPATLAQSP